MHHLTVAAKCLPVAARLQADRTAVDRDLEQLRRSHKVRLFKLPTGADDYGIMTTEDYVALIRALCCSSSEQSSGGSGAGQSISASGGMGGASSSATADASSAGFAGSAARQNNGDGSARSTAVVDAFVTRVLPACADLHVSRDELLRLLGAAPPRVGGAAGAANASGTANSDGAGSGAASITAADAEGLISTLLARSLLARHTSSESAYIFTVPQLGATVKAIAAGRRELLAAIGRRKRQEVLERELLSRNAKLKLRQSALGPEFHVRDLLGSGRLVRLASAAGPVLKAVNTA